jgi:predicted amidohydrolase
MLLNREQACFLPEAADFIVATTEACYDLSQPLSSHTYTRGLQDLAKELNVWIASGVHELPGSEDDEAIKSESKQGKKVFNTYVAIDPQGELVTSYRKVRIGDDIMVLVCLSRKLNRIGAQIHLFDVALKDPTAPSPAPNPDGSLPSIPRRGESERMLAGNKIQDPVNMGPGIGNVGLEICYDLRFPEMHGILVDRGAGTLVFPSAFTLKTGRDHWGESTSRECCDKPCLLR